MFGICPICRRNITLIPIVPNPLFVAHLIRDDGEEICKFSLQEYKRKKK